MAAASWLGPLYGGGFWVAFRQLAAVGAPPPPPPPAARLRGRWQARAAGPCSLHLGCLQPACMCAPACLCRGGHPSALMAPPPAPRLPPPFPPPCRPQTGLLPSGLHPALGRPQPLPSEDGAGGSAAQGPGGLGGRVQHRWAHPCGPGFVADAWRRRGASQAAAGFHCTPVLCMPCHPASMQRAPGPDLCACPRLPVPGPLLVKAGVWTLVEQLHASGRAKLYTGWPPSAQQVRRCGGSGCSGAVAAAGAACAAAGRSLP